MEKILIVEDDIAFGTMIQTWLRKKGFEVEKATSVKAAIQVCEEAERGFDLVLSDLRLPDHDGIFLLQWMRKHGVQVPFIVMTSYAEIQNVVLAMKSGATDYVAKPFHPEILLDKIKEAIKTPKNRIRMQPQQIVCVPQHNSDSYKRSTWQAGRNQASSANGDVPKYLEGESEASRKLYSFVSLVAPTPMSVLILGASGTGKEYVAQQHPRTQQLEPDKPFFALDCGAIPKEVAASEFFGHVKGCLYGSRTGQEGRFRDCQRRRLSSSMRWET